MVSFLNPLAYLVYIQCANQRTLHVHDWNFAWLFNIAEVAHHFETLNLQKVCTKRKLQELAHGPLHLPDALNGNGILICLYTGSSSRHGA